MINYGKKQQYYIGLQKILQQDKCIDLILVDIEDYNKNQQFLKRIPKLRLTDYVTFYFFEYINLYLKRDYSKFKNINYKMLDFLYNKINYTCIKLRSITTDSVWIPLMRKSKNKYIKKIGL